MPPVSAGGWKFTESLTLAYDLRMEPPAVISNCWAEAKLANRKTAHADVSSANFLNTVPLPVRVDLWNGPARLMTLYGAAANGSPATIRVLGIGCSGYQIRDDSRGQKLFLAAEGVSDRS